MANASDPRQLDRPPEIEIDNIMPYVRAMNNREALAADAIILDVENTLDGYDDLLSVNTNTEDSEDEPPAPPNTDNEEDMSTPDKVGCPVCLRLFDHGMAPASLTCGHVTCLGCLLASIDTRSQCPVCRVNGTLEDAHLLF